MTKCLCSLYSMYMKHVLYCWVCGFAECYSCGVFMFVWLSDLWTVSSCSLTMCASCWKMEPNSTMVLSMFCMVSARLWIYESYKNITKGHLMLKSNIQRLSYSQTLSYKQQPRLQSLPNFLRDWYLFIDELQLQRVCSRVHVDGHLSSQTPRLILHQNWAVCESQEI